MIQKFAFGMPDNKLFHWPGLVAAILVGVCVSLPNWVFINSPEYKGVPIMQTDAESFYLTRIHAAYHGCILGCNPYLKEYGAEYPSFDPSISPALLALPGIIFHLNVLDLKIIYDFLLPFILALLVYALAFRLTINRNLSVLGTLFTLLGYAFINNVTTTFLLYARPVNPQWSSIVFFLFLHALLYFLEKSTKKSTALLVLVYALTFYTYFYLYSFCTVALIVLTIFYLFKKEYRFSARVIFASLLGLILGLPMIRQLWSLIHDPLYTSIPSASLITHSHLPSLSLWAICLFVSFLCIARIYYEKYKVLDTNFIFIFILGLASFIILNEQVITGMNVQNFHYVWYYITPIFILAVLHILNILKLKPGLILTIILACLPIYKALSIDYTDYRNIHREVVEDQQKIGVLNWLNEVPKGSVVYAPDRLSRLIGVYTDNFVYWSYFASGFLMPEERRLDLRDGAEDEKRFMQNMYKYQVDYMVIPRGEISHYLINPEEEPLYTDDSFLVYSAK